jgi:hypothetical protein
MHSEGQISNNETFRNNPKRNNQPTKKKKLQLKTKLVKTNSGKRGKIKDMLPHLDHVGENTLIKVKPD